MQHIMGVAIFIERSRDIMEQFTFINNLDCSLKQALTYYCTGLNSQDINNIIKNKDVKINGVRVKENVAIKPNVEITVYYSHKKYYDILYQDENVVIINKIKSIETNSDEYKQTLLYELSKEYPTIIPIHRLDTNTLGIMCFALNEVASQELVYAFKSGQVIKKYLAVVSQDNIQTSGQFQDSFVKTKDNIVRFDYAQNDGNDARLSYELMSKKDDLAIILVTLHTGKTHQIRAQLSYHKIYILGDGKYGDKNLNRKYKKSYQCLTSVYLEFTKLDKLKYLENKPFDIIKEIYNNIIDYLG